MRRDGLLDKLLKLIRAYYARTRTKLRSYEAEPKCFGVQTGQSCVLSPIQFNYIIDWILVNSMNSLTGVRVGPNFSTTDLDFADDVAILGESYTEVQHALGEVDRISKLVGMRINASK